MLEYNILKDPCYFVGIKALSHINYSSNYSLSEMVSDNGSKFQPCDLIP